MTYAKLLKDASGNNVLPYTRSTLVYMEGNSTLQAVFDMLDNKVDELSGGGFVQFFDDAEIPTDDRLPNTLYARILDDYSA